MAAAAIIDRHEDAASADPIEVALQAGLRYVSDDRPGITRRRAGTGFSYRDANGSRIAPRREIARIRAIGIPPAWTGVWICPSANGHIQATGRDARGRKQYRYHPDWRAARDASKFDRLAEFGLVLPRLRARLEADLALAGQPRERILAAVVWLIDRTLVRVGSDEYARLNESYGASTLRNEHVTVDGADVQLRFRGKHGKEQHTRFRDPRIAAILRRCQELPGEELFSYVDEQGTPRRVDSGDVNDYLREIAGEAYTVKDFRTWGGSSLFYQVLSDAGPSRSARDATQMITVAVKLVAAQLGNTPAVCRSAYIHPALISGYAGGTLPLPLDELDLAGLAARERRFLSALEAMDAASR